MRAKIASYVQCVCLSAHGCLPGTLRYMYVYNIVLSLLLIVCVVYYM
jgi:hypothetical protein